MIGCGNSSIYSLIPDYTLAKQMDSFFQRSSIPSGTEKKELGKTTGMEMPNCRSNQTAPFSIGGFSFSMSVAPQPKKEKLVGYEYASSCRRQISLEFRRVIHKRRRYISRR